MLGPSTAKQVSGWIVTAACLLILLGTGALGTFIGLMISDHERRIAFVESTRFTAADSREMVKGLRSDIAEIKRLIEELRIETARLSPP